MEYPESEKKIKQLEQQFKVRTMRIKNQPHSEEGGTGRKEDYGQGIQGGRRLRRIPENVEEEVEQDLPVDVLLKQVETGMFKSSDNRISIEQKIDTLLEQIKGEGPVREKRDLIIPRKNLPPKI